MIKLFIWYKSFLQPWKIVKTFFILLWFHQIWYHTSESLTFEPATKGTQNIYNVAEKKLIQEYVLRLSLSSWEFSVVNRMTTRQLISYWENESSKICLIFVFLFISFSLIFDEYIFIKLVHPIIQQFSPTQVRIISVLKFAASFQA